MIQSLVRSSAALIDHSGLEVDEDGTRNMLALACLRKEGVEGIITPPNSLVGRQLRQERRNSVAGGAGANLEESKPRSCQQSPSGSNSFLTRI